MLSLIGKKAANMLPFLSTRDFSVSFFAADDIEGELAQVDVGEETLAVDGGDKALVAVARREKLPTPLDEDLLRFGGNCFYVLRLGNDYELVTAHVANECIGPA